MKETLKETKNRLSVTFWTTIIIPLVAALLFEIGIVLPGYFAAESVQAEFVLTAVMELLTVLFIPLALRMFKMLGTKVHDARTLWHYGVLRIGILALLLWGNTILYYLFMNATFGYMAIITLIAMMFVYPSIDKCKAEVGGCKDDETDMESAE